MSVLVKADRLTKSFGPTQAVDGISLKVKKGEVLGFLGPNGAGKSTTMKMITGFLEPDTGLVEVCGIDLASDPQAAKRHIGYLPEGAPLYGDMTPRSLLNFAAEIRGLSGKRRSEAIAGAVEKTGLQSVVDRRIDALSKGFNRRVGLAQAILHDPDILILDEPTDGLDPNQKHHVRELIREMAKRKAIIISTHILEEVDAVCTRAVVIDRGRIVADNTAAELQKRAPAHNSVSIRIASAKARDLRAALSGHAAISKIETISRANGASHLRALSKTGEPIAAEIAAILKKKSIQAQEIYVERGNLDDVFRLITSQDTGGDNA